MNYRKEFFRVSIDEIAEEVRRHNADIQITKVAEAKQYWQSVAMIQAKQEIPYSETLGVAA